jgi:hypothetical protein
MNYCFQDAWTIKLPWLESLVGVDGKVHKVKCKVCNKIEIRCNKLLISKLNFLARYVGQKTSTIIILNVIVVGEY